MPGNMKELIRQWRALIAAASGDPNTYPVQQARLTLMEFMNCFADTETLLEPKILPEPKSSNALAGQLASYLQAAGVAKEAEKAKEDLVGYLPGESLQDMIDSGAATLKYSGNLQTTSNFDRDLLPIEEEKPVVAEKTLPKTRPLTRANRTKK
jgi:hypothetical protein